MQNRIQCSRNVLKPNTTFEEGRDRHLVGGIQRDGLRASRFDCLVGQT